MTRRLFAAALIVAAALVPATPVGAGCDDMAVAKSALRHTILAAQPVAYWPLEDDAGATSAASALAGGSPMKLLTPDPVVFAGVTPPAGSEAAPDFSAGATLGHRLVGIVTGTSSAAWTIEFIANTSKSGFDRMVTGLSTSGDIGEWQFYPQTPDDSLPMTVAAANKEPGVPGFETSFANIGEWDVWRHYRFTVSQDGADINTELWVDGVRVTGSGVGLTAGALTQIFVARNGDDVAQMDITSVAHVAIYNGVMSEDHSAAMAGYAGEDAVDRIIRLCREEGVRLYVDGRGQMSPAP